MPHYVLGGKRREVVFCSAIERRQCRRFRELKRRKGRNEQAGSISSKRKRGWTSSGGPAAGGGRGDPWAFFHLSYPHGAA